MLAGGQPSLPWSLDVAVVTHLLGIGALGGQGHCPLRGTCRASGLEAFAPSQISGNDSSFEVAERSRALGCCAGFLPSWVLLE